MINTVVKHVAECRARKDDQGASAVVSTALLLYSVAAVIALVFSVALAPVVPRLFNIADADQLTAVRLAIRVAGGSSAPSGEADCANSERSSMPAASTMTIQDRAIANRVRNVVLKTVSGYLGLWVRRGDVQESGR